MEKIATKKTWLVDKTTGTVTHSINGLTLTIENGEVINVDNVSSAITVGALPGLLREGLSVYKNLGVKMNKTTGKHLPSRPVLSLKKKAN